MKILLDTNIILDALMERTPFDFEAKEILLRSQNGEIECLFTANAATDIFYLYRKARDIQTAKATLHFLLTKEDIGFLSSLYINNFRNKLPNRLRGLVFDTVLFASLRLR